MLGDGTILPALGKPTTTSRTKYRCDEPQSKTRTPCSHLDTSLLQALVFASLHLLFILLGLEQRYFFSFFFFFCIAVISWCMVMGMMMISPTTKFPLPSSALRTVTNV